jgi:hypothetical protein
MFLFPRSAADVFGGNVTPFQVLVGHPIYFRS